jgi:hypothetical protein
MASSASSFDISRTDNSSLALAMSFLRRQEPSRIHVAGLDHGQSRQVGTRNDGRLDSRQMIAGMTHPQLVPFRMAMRLES